MKSERIQKNIDKRNVCFWCGKPYTFETGQYYKIGSANKKDKHILSKWCSNVCLNEAEGSDTKISTFNKGIFHNHKGDKTCLGEFK